jgi:Protein of unknown function (DUF2511)
MARVALASLALVAAVALAACGRKEATVTDPVEGVPMHQQLTISRSEVGHTWPFTAGTGTLACDGGALFFRTGGTTYALSKGAGTRGYANVDTIRLVQGAGPPSDPVSRLTQDVRTKLFAQAAECASTSSTAESARVAECKARIRVRSGITESELTRIEAEGVERNWPPLPPVLMSLDSMIAAARQLCPR